MSNFVGTVSRGIKLPIVKEGDDLAAIVATSVLDAAAGEPFALHDRDVVAITESVVARTSGWSSPSSAATASRSASRESPRPPKR